MRPVVTEKGKQSLRIRIDTAFLNDLCLPTRHLSHDKPFSLNFDISIVMQYLDGLRSLSFRNSVSTEVCLK